MHSCFVCLFVLLILYLIFVVLVAIVHARVRILNCLCVCVGGFKSDGMLRRWQPVTASVNLVGERGFGRHLET